jgi:hypothetical protein
VGQSQGRHRGIEFRGSGPISQLADMDRASPLSTFDSIALFDTISIKLLFSLNNFLQVEPDFCLMFLANHILCRERLGPPGLELCF